MDRLKVGDRVVVYNVYGDDRSPYGRIIKTDFNSTDRYPYCVEMKEGGMSVWVSGDQIELVDEGEQTSTEGMKYDQEKPDWTLFYFEGLNEVAKVLTYGAKKYAPDNWQKVDPKRYEAAMFRHLSAYMEGEEVDEETGLSHLAHAMCCINFLQWHNKD